MKALLLAASLSTMIMLLWLTVVLSAEEPPVSLEMDCQMVHYEADTDRSIRLCMNDLERCYESWAGISCVPRGR